jgi:hypothetical protein
VTQLIYVDLDSRASGDALLQAACTLDEEELRQRLAEWIALRDRSVEVRVTAQGALLQLAADEALDGVARLVNLESACCGFYRFSLRVSGPTRELEIDAGPGGGEAVKALLSMDA